MQRLVGLIIFLCAGIGAYFCVANVLWQQHAVRDFVPVPARILGTRIQSHRGSKGGTTYSPEATYSYTYQGRDYQATRVLPIQLGQSSRSWAQGVLDRIDRRGDWPGPGIGTLSTAYIDPQYPQDAILVRDYSFFPYAFGMGTLVAATLGLGMLAGVIGLGRSRMAAVALDDSGWQLLLPRIQLRKQLRNAVICFFLFSAAIVAMPAHWVLVAGQKGTAMLVSGAIAGGFVIVLGLVAFRRWSVSRHLSDARLRIKPAPVPRGEPFAMEVGIDAYTPLRVTNLQAKIVCVEHYKEKSGNKTTVGTRTRTEKILDLCRQQEVPAGQEVTGRAEVTLERNLPPTTDLVVKVYPYFTWEIRLKLALEGAVDYAAVFPLEVD